MGIVVTEECLGTFFRGQAFMMINRLLYYEIEFNDTF